MKQPKKRVEPIGQTNEEIMEITKKLSKQLAKKYPRLNHVLLVFNNMIYQASGFGDEQYCANVAELYTKAVRAKLTQKEPIN